MCDINREKEENYSITEYCVPITSDVSRARALEAERERGFAVEETCGAQC